MLSPTCVCPDCGRIGAALSHNLHLGLLTVSAVCRSPLCARTWKIYSVRIKSEGVLING
jgi:hypothetical protein